MYSRTQRSCRPSHKSVGKSGNLDRKSGPPKARLHGSPRPSELPKPKRASEPPHPMIQARIRLIFIPICFGHARLRAGIRCRIVDQSERTSAPCVLASRCLLFQPPKESPVECCLCGDPARQHDVEASHTRSATDRRATIAREPGIEVQSRDDGCWERRGAVVIRPTTGVGDADTGITLLHVRQERRLAQPPHSRLSRMRLQQRP